MGGKITFGRLMLTPARLALAAACGCACFMSLAWFHYSLGQLDEQVLNADLFEGRRAYLVERAIDDDHYYNLAAPYIDRYELSDIGDVNAPKVLFLSDSVDIRFANADSLISASIGVIVRSTIVDAPRLDAPRRCWWVGGEGGEKAVDLSGVVVFSSGARCLVSPKPDGWNVVARNLETETLIVPLELSEGALPRNWEWRITSAIVSGRLPVLSDVHGDDRVLDRATNRRLNMRAIVGADVQDRKRIDELSEAAATTNVVGVFAAIAAIGLLVLGQSKLLRREIGLFVVLGASVSEVAAYSVADAALQSAVALLPSLLLCLIVFSILHDEPWAVEFMTYASATAALIISVGTAFGAILAFTALREDAGVLIREVE